MESAQQAPQAAAAVDSVDPRELDVIKDIEEKLAMLIATRNKNSEIVELRRQMHETIQKLNEQVKENERLKTSEQAKIVKINDLESELTCIRQMLRDSAKAKGDLSRDQDELEQQLRDAKEELAEEQKSKEKIRSKMFEYVRGKTVEYDTHVKSLQQQLIKVKEELAAEQKKNLNDREKAVHYQQAESQSHEDTVRELEMELGEARRRLEDAAPYKKSTYKLIKKACYDGDRVQESEEKMESLKSALDESKAHFLLLKKQAEHDVKELRGKNVELEKALHKAKTDLGRARAELTKAKKTIEETEAKTKNANIRRGNRDLSPLNRYRRSPSPPSNRYSSPARGCRPRDPDTRYDEVRRGVGRETSRGDRYPTASRCNYYEEYFGNNTQRDSYARARSPQRKADNFRRGNEFAYNPYRDGSPVAKRSPSPYSGYFGLFGRRRSPIPARWYSPPRATSLVAVKKPVGGCCSPDGKHEAGGPYPVAQFEGYFPRRDVSPPARQIGDSMRDVPGNARFEKFNLDAPQKRREAYFESNKRFYGVAKKPEDPKPKKQFGRQIPAKSEDSKQQQQKARQERDAMIARGGFPRNNTGSGLLGPVVDSSDSENEEEVRGFAAHPQPTTSKMVVEIVEQPQSEGEEDSDDEW